MQIYMKKLVTILFTILLVSVSAGLAGNRRALVIGVGCQKDSSWPEIHGDMDVHPVVEMLSSNGFTDIRTLVNASATKAALSMLSGSLLLIVLPATWSISIFPVMDNG